MILDLLASPLVQRMLIVGLLVGLAAPVVGTYLVQRRMALLGDGIGHVALAGVAAGWLAGTVADATDRSVYALPGAIVFAIGAAALIEAMRARGTAAADVIMAVLFYGGIALGVLLIAWAGGTNAYLLGYLFGSISTVSWAEVVASGVLAAAILLVGLALRPALFAVTHDQEFAKSTGLPVRTLNMVVAILAAVTITVAMRVVGVLLVSALMIVPVAIAQQLTQSFNRTMAIAMALGTALTITGIAITLFVDLQPGALIVVLGVTLYALVSLGLALAKALRNRSSQLTSPAKSAP